MAGKSYYPEPNISKFLFASRWMAPIWALIRIYVGYEWLKAGWGKVHESTWVGAQAGTSIAGFLHGSLSKVGGAHPSVMGWYGWLIQHVFLPHAAVMSYLVAFGELFVGVALILGLLTGLSAFFGGFMNASYLLAGTVSTNPLLFILATWLVLAWRVAGYYGLDFFVLPRLGAPRGPHFEPQREPRGEPRTEPHAKSAPEPVTVRTR